MKTTYIVLWKLQNQNIESSGHNASSALLCHRDVWERSIYRAISCESSTNYESVHTWSANTTVSPSSSPPGTFRYAYTAISRKVVRKNVHATIPKGHYMWYDQCTVPDTVAVESSIVAFFSICKHSSMASSLVPFFQISLKNIELKTTYNTFWDCRMHFFRRPFSK